MYTIAISNRKGGAGKTATAAALGAYLSSRYRVLYVDLDDQGNLSYSTGAGNAGKGIYDAIRNPCNTADMVTHAAEGDILASTPALGEPEAMRSPWDVSRALETVKGNYDFCVIDTAPALGMGLINALTAADGLLIPAQADIYSYGGISQLENAIDAVKGNTNRDLEILGILITFYNARTVLSRDITEATEELAESLGTRLLRSRIRACNAIREAAIRRINIFKYSPRSNAAKDYNAAAEELLKIIGGKQ